MSQKLLWDGRPRLSGTDAIGAEKPVEAGWLTCPFRLLKPINATPFPSYP